MTAWISVKPLHERLLHTQFSSNLRYNKNRKDMKKKINIMHDNVGHVPKTLNFNQTVGLIY